MPRRTYSEPTAQADPLESILPLWSQFSPEAQLTNQLRMMQIAQEQQKMSALTQANRWAQTQGYPTVEAFHYGTAAKEAAARTEEAKAYHENVSAQHDQSRMRDLLPLASNEQGLVDQNRLRELVIADREGWLPDYLKGQQATEAGKKEEAQAVRDIAEGRDSPAAQKYKQAHPPKVTPPPATTTAPPSPFPGYFGNIGPELMQGAVSTPRVLANLGVGIANKAVLPVNNAIASLLGAPPIPRQPYMTPEQDPILQFYNRLIGTQPQPNK